MSEYRALTGKELIAALRKAGFEIVRIKGSHHRLAHGDGRKTVGPVHTGETIGPGLLARILRDCKLKKADLDDLL